LRALRASRRGIFGAVSAAGSAPGPPGDARATAPATAARHPPAERSQAIPSERVEIASHRFRHPLVVSFALTRQFHLPGPAGWGSGLC
jgi:hypothetical protein